MAHMASQVLLKALLLHLGGDGAEKTLEMRQKVFLAHEYPISPPKEVFRGGF